MIKKAQALSEYLVLFTLIAMALASMQLYFRRSIQAVVKIAADEVGDQKSGVAEYDPEVELVEIKVAPTITNSQGRNTAAMLPAGAVTYSSNDSTEQEGGITFGVTKERE